MKRKFIMTALLLAMFVLGSSFYSFASQWKSDSEGWWWEEDDGSYPVNSWKEINGGWYYFNENGYMAANSWIGNYYLGADGKMLTDTITPDGYRVGIDGAWVSRPRTPYYDLLFNPLFYGPKPETNEWGFKIAGDLSDTIDHGDYYELKNQYLYNYAVYDSEEQAKQTIVYENYGLGWVERHPSGKYIVPLIGDSYDTNVIYSGSVYIHKNVIIEYQYDDENHDIKRGTCTWEEYFALPESRSILGKVKQVDEKGYATFIDMNQAG